jgi:hypothetical protein
LSTDQGQVLTLRSVIIIVIRNSNSNNISRRSRSSSSSMESMYFELVDAVYDSTPATDVFTMASSPHMLDRPNNTVSSSPTSRVSTASLATIPGIPDDSCDASLYDTIESYTEGDHPATTIEEVFVWDNRARIYPDTCPDGRFRADYGPRFDVFGCPELFDFLKDEIDMTNNDHVNYLTTNLTLTPIMDDMEKEYIVPENFAAHFRDKVGMARNLWGADAHDFMAQALEDDESDDETWPEEKNTVSLKEAVASMVQQHQDRLKPLSVASTPSDRRSRSPKSDEAPLVLRRSARIEARRKEALREHGSLSADRVSKSPRNRSGRAKGTSQMAGLVNTVGSFHQRFRHSNPSKDRIIREWIRNVDRASTLPH